MGPQHPAERLARVQADADLDQRVKAMLGVPAIDEPDDLPSTQDGAPGIIRPRRRNDEIRMDNRAGSMCSARAVEPRRSTNRTVISWRLPRRQTSRLLPSMS